MRVDHIGYAVSDIEKAKKEFENLGYEVDDTIEDNNRGVRLAFAKNQHEVIELIAPNGEQTPVDTVLKKNGPTPYHICYRTENLDEQVSKLQKRNWILIQKADPAIAFGNRRVVFLYHVDVGIIELVEE